MMNEYNFYNLVYLYEFEKKMYFVKCLLDTTAMTFSQNASQLHFCDAPKHDMD